MTISSPSPRLLALAGLAVTAGREIMAIYAKPLTAREKADLTPVTEADETAERIILAGLKSQDPDIPVISEEAAAAGFIPETGERFYLVDPLDGTKEFLSRNGEFTVNIALIDKGSPIAGVVLAPALGRLFCGETGGGAFEAHLEAEANVKALAWHSLKARVAAPDGPVVVASRSHRDQRTEAFLKCLKVKRIVSAGSSLKFCLLASGEADLYPRFGRTMEWDTAAGHAVLTAAGGYVGLETGEPLTYGKAGRGYDNPGA
ncbi:MAG: 3'(2'),5'-bisphosphate nucleotidase CysQ [Alphaproteobacteria bacterium]|nr:MAG: 3'(2'),5'-bisphosphate nucleotidase CysQ [Alphaproteobacteria bacterium]